MTHNFDCIDTQQNESVLTPVCAGFEYIVRIIMSDLEGSKHEFGFSSYGNAVCFVYEKYHQLFGKVKRIELLDALSYRLPLMVLEKT